MTGDDGPTHESQTGRRATGVQGDAMELRAAGVARAFAMFGAGWIGTLSCWICLQMESWLYSGRVPCTQEPRQTETAMVRLVAIFVGAIERVDDPYPVCADAMRVVGAFFGQHGIVGTKCLQRLHQESMRRNVA